MFADYHTHTEFSDDSDYRMEQAVEDAIAMGMDEICFTDHVDYGIKKDWDVAWNLVCRPTPLLYTAQSLPLSVMLFTGFFTAIPNEMMEAAVIDGCTIYQMLVKVIFPLMMNSIMMVLTLQFMSSWNDLIYSQTFISLAEKRTLQTPLIMFNGSHGEVNWGPLFAAMSITIIPTLVIYIFLSKFMIRGMTSGAVKG